LEYIGAGTTEAEAFRMAILNALPLGKVVTAKKNYSCLKKPLVNCCNATFYLLCYFKPICPILVPANTSFRKVKTIWEFNF